MFSACLVTRSWNVGVTDIERWHVAARFVLQDRCALRRASAPAANAQAATLGPVAGPGPAPSGLASTSSDRRKPAEAVFTKWSPSKTARKDRLTPDLMSAVVALAAKGGSPLEAALAKEAPALLGTGDIFVVRGVH